jgi:microcystin degradation protein MlrC
MAAAFTPFKTDLNHFSWRKCAQNGTTPKINTVPKQKVRQVKKVHIMHKTNLSKIELTWAKHTKPGNQSTGNTLVNSAHIRRKIEERSRH